MVIDMVYTPMNVVELNSLAVLQMRQQQFGQALSTLQTAVVVLEEIYRTNMIGCHQPNKKRRRLSSDESVSSDTEDDAVGVVQSVQVLDEKAQAKLVSNSAVPNDDVLLFYDRAFTFQNFQNIDFELSENKSSLSALPTCSKLCASTDWRTCHWSK
ncbi:expressed unknown protein [Seminavis robusta]|uniref:Uncharacterized protein n=1 Tax=Seminavis robusta TaxID=568900 RepID=A0A9N8EWE0_9STRA|nr:expressed unknown protein [Seminavis robusta]|eukprot:Sro1754_g295450.1 n/a (156) ;mRNA; r:6586-7111